MAAELPRPGVEVIQEFKSVSPTVVTPTLPPCIVGVCRQVVDVLVPSAGGGSVLNNDALVPLPAQFVAANGTGSPAVYTGLDGLNLAVSINNNAPFVITFTGNTLTPAQVVATILEAMGAEAVTTITAEVVGDDAWRLRTVASGQYQSIEVLVGVGMTDPTVLSAFDLGPRLYTGADGYSQHGLRLSSASFPDPRKNLDQLVFENDTIRAFLFLGATGQLKELRRTESYLRRGTNYAPVMTFTGDLTGVGVVAALDTQTLLVAFTDEDDVVHNATVTFATPVTPQDVVDQVAAAFGATVGTYALDVTGKFLVITSNYKGPHAIIGIPTGTAVGLGFPVAAVTGVTGAAAVANGSGTNVTSLIQFPNQNFTQSANAPVVYGTVTVTSVADGLTLILDDGYTQQTVIFDTAINPAAILSQINAVVDAGAGGHITATTSNVVVATGLTLTGTDLGEDQKVKVVGGTALTALGLTVGQIDFGRAFPVAPSDELWINGSKYADVVQVVSATTVKVNKSVALEADLASNWYFIAKKLVYPALAGRPEGNLKVDILGQVSIKPDILRDTTGTPVANSVSTLYLAYHAVRQDVTALAKNPGLLRFDDTIALGNALEPISTDNPLGLGFYFALLNSPGSQVTGVGVDAVAANAPYGTVEAYARAATFIEAFEVYGLAPLTNDLSVGQVFSTHASVMSAPENKGERIALFNPSQPTNKLDTLVAAGANGNSSPTTNQFDTGIQNLGALLLAAGINPTGPIPVSAGVWLNIASSANKYAIIAVSGATVTVKTSGFTSGQNDDGYYATTTLSSILIAESFAVRIRGAALVNVDGTPDKNGIAATYSGLAAGSKNRRLWQITAGQTAATLDGLEQTIPGFYLCAGIAGMIAQQPPQQSFTNFPMTGFTRVIGTNGFLTEKQMNQMAAQGCYIVVQDSAGAPLTARMALTTDMTSIETRTDSITKVVDFTAKFLRQGLRNFIGRFNITQGFLDTLGHVIQGLLGFLTETGVLIGAHLNNIIQDADAPDTVLVDITLDVPFPCNYIRLTLVV